MKRVPLYRQLDSNDCGPTCLRMIAAYYGKKYSLDTIKQYCEMTRIGISMRDIVHCGKKLGFEIASVRVNLREARRMPVPAILYFKKGHFVVLDGIEIKRNRYVYSLADPDYGRVKIKEEDLVDNWMGDGCGIAAVMAPNERFGCVEEKRDEQHKSFRKIYEVVSNIIRQERKKFMWIALLSLIVTATNWAMPLLLKTTIDAGIMDKNIRVVWQMLAAQFAFFIGFMLAGNVSNLLSTRAGIRIDVAFVSAYFHKLIKLPMHFFDIGRRTELIQKLGDLSRISTFMTDNLLSIGFALLNVIVFSALLLVYNYEVFLIFIAFSFVSFVYNTYFIRKRKYVDYAGFTLNSERNNAVQEMVLGMTEIKINHAQQARISIWQRLEDKVNRLRIKTLYIDYYMSNGASTLGRLRDITLTGICAFLVIRDNMTMGTMMMVSFLLGQLSVPINELLAFMKNMQDAHLSALRLNEIFGKHNESEDGSLSLNGKRIERGLRFVNVSFKYAGISNSYVLKNINLEIPVGKVTAIVGASGSGKTTLLKLMLGFYYPVVGDLYVDDYKMKDVDMDTWRDRCGVVMQDGRIFSGTVAENIAFADETPDPMRLQEAARIAAIEERIKVLPMGYHTRIGETGINLSGGEKQRIFIARAVYKQPDFVFFDEATSSLDANTERTILSNLQKFYQGRTVLIIAHRLSTVKQADNIVLMDDGEIMEQGNHEELLKLNGYYRRLVENQLEI